MKRTTHTNTHIQPSILCNKIPFVSHAVSVLESVNESTSPSKDLKVISIVKTMSNMCGKFVASFYLYFGVISTNSNTFNILLFRSSSFDIFFPLWLFFFFLIYSVCVAVRENIDISISLQFVTLQYWVQFSSTKRHHKSMETDNSEQSAEKLFIRSSKWNEMEFCQVKQCSQIYRSPFRHTLSYTHTYTRAHKHQVHTT